MNLVPFVRELYVALIIVAEEYTEAEGRTVKLEARIPWVVGCAKSPSCAASNVIFLPEVAVMSPEAGDGPDSS